MNSIQIEERLRALGSKNLLHRARICITMGGAFLPVDMGDGVYDDSREKIQLSPDQCFEAVIEGQPLFATGSYAWIELDMRTVIVITPSYFRQLTPLELLAEAADCENMVEEYGS